MGRDWWSTARWNIGYVSGQIRLQHLSLAGVLGLYSVLRKGAADGTVGSAIAGVMRPDTCSRAAHSTGLLIQTWRKCLRDASDLAGHDALDEIHGESKVGRVE